MSCDDEAELEHQTKTEVTYILLSLYLYVSTLKLQMQSSSYGDGLMDQGLGLGLGTQLEVRECDVYGGRTLLSVHDNTRPVDEGISYNCRYKVARMKGMFARYGIP